MKHRCDPRLHLAMVYAADTISRRDVPVPFDRTWSVIGWLLVVAWSLPGWLFLLITPRMMPGSEMGATIMIAPFLLPLAIELGRLWLSATSARIQRRRGNERQQL
jgi:hypothetical protein